MGYFFSLAQTLLRYGLLLSFGSNALTEWVTTPLWLGHFDLLGYYSTMAWTLFFNGLLFSYGLNSLL